MVHTGAIGAIVFNIIISFGLPLGLLAYLLVKYGRPVVRPVLVGVLVFLIMQMVIRIPLVMFIWPKTPAFAQLMLYPVSYGLFLGLTAGLAEEGGRWLGYTTILRKRTDWLSGFSYGVGHAGVESVVLVGMMSVNDLLYALHINRGTLGPLVTGLEQRLLNRIQSYLVNLEPTVVMLEGVERILVFVIQIAFSLMVLYGVRTKNAFWLALAILAHTAVDASVVILPKIMDFGPYKIQLLLLAWTIAGLWFIVKSRQMFSKVQPLK